LNVLSIKSVRQTEMHTAEPLVPDAGPFEVGIAVGKLTRYILIKFQQN